MEIIEQLFPAAIDFLMNQLGVYVLGMRSNTTAARKHERRYVTASSTVSSSGYRPVLVNSVTLDRHVETRERFGGNVILDYKLPSGSIKSVNMISRLNSNDDDIIRR